MRKNLQKTHVVAPLTARAPNSSSPIEPRRDAAQNPWLSRQVAQRLDEGRAMLIDLATDLPFATVLRGRVSPPRMDVVAQAEPMARLIDQFKDQLPALSVDATFLRERLALIERLVAFEEAGENFLGLIRRTKAVMAAQLEKALRSSYQDAAQSAAVHPEIARALQAMAPVLGAPAQKSKKR
ncbi:MAG: hypothetical protein RMK29_06615 [Myxococcales bacterium]|nr:hypothetical protein [Myxococcota bacterium]MDW8281366.1 hypothetical protein [Myxococcales bacterium]